MCGAAARRRTGLLRVAFFIFFCFVKSAGQLGKKLAVMYHPITVDPNPMGIKTDGDAVLELAVMTPAVVVT